MPLSELQEGRTGAEVRVAQQFLNDAHVGPPRLAPDGIFGPFTRAAVLNFQRLRGLDQDGVVGEHTWDALQHPASFGPAKRLATGNSPAAAPPRPSGATPGAAPAAIPRAAPSAPKPADAPAPTADDRVDPAGEPAWLKVALAEKGIHERTPQGSRRIVEYHQATTLHAQSDQVAWCSSFVNWCLQQVGIVGSRSAAAASWRDWGVGLATPRLGCIVQLHHHVKGYTSATGTSSGNHVAFFIHQDAAHIRLLGGNQSDSVRFSDFPLARWSVTAYRWPKGV